MKGYCLLLLVLPLCARPQRLSGADLRKIKQYCTGSFSNTAQVRTDSVFPASIRIQPIWQKRRDGAWLFADRKDSIYRPQVWHFYLQDDTTLILQTFDFKDTLKPAMLRSNIASQSKLAIYNLSSRNGCEVYLERERGGRYHGASGGNECFAAAGGEAYYRYQLYFAGNEISWLEQIFDKSGRLADNRLSRAVVFTRAPVQKK